MVARPRQQEICKNETIWSSVSPMSSRIVLSTTRSTVRRTCAIAAAAGEMNEQLKSDRKAATFAAVVGWSIRRKHYGGAHPPPRISVISPTQRARRSTVATVRLRWSEKSSTTFGRPKTARHPWPERGFWAEYYRFVRAFVDPNANEADSWCTARLPSNCLVKQPVPR